MSFATFTYPELLVLQKALRLHSMMAPSSSTHLLQQCTQELSVRKYSSVFNSTNQPGRPG